MRSNDSFKRLRKQAITLRRAGKSRREIQEILGIKSHGTLNEALKGEPPPPWTARPNAKDGQRTMARELRTNGWSYDEIAAELGVSKSSISLWVRDLPRPEWLSIERVRERTASRMRHQWRSERLRRAIERNRAKVAAAREIGHLSEREIVIAGALLYWCEGAKDKIYRRSEQVRFINSDPSVILLFLRFLELIGIEPGRIVYRVHIHETADVEAATDDWAELIGAQPEQFVRPNIKRHKPQTNRRNVGADYRGCLEVIVRRSSELYRKIEGWAFGAMLGPEFAEERWARVDPA